MSDSDTNSDSNLDYKSNGYIVLCRIFHTAQSQSKIPILTDNYSNGIGIGIRIRIRICECKEARTRFDPRYLSTNLPIDSCKILFLANLPDGFRQVLVFDILEINAYKKELNKALEINYSGCVINIR